MNKKHFVKLEVRNNDTGVSYLFPYISKSDLCEANAKLLELKEKGYDAEIIVID